MIALICLGQDPPRRGGMAVFLAISVFFLINVAWVLWGTPRRRGLPEPGPAAGDRTDP